MDLYSKNPQFPHTRDSSLTHTQQCKHQLHLTQNTGMGAANPLILQKMASKHVAQGKIRYVDLGFGGEHVGVSVRATIDHMTGMQFGKRVPTTQE